MATVSSKLIRFGHSPDPDDAFMFYAIAHETINLRGFKVGHVIEDIESLNQRALGVGADPRVGPQNTGGHIGPPLEVTAVSCHAYAYLSDRYQVMPCGASVGDKYGPILVRKAEGGRQKAEGFPSSSFLRPSNSQTLRIAVPGKMTTAYLALQLYAKLNRFSFEPVWIPFDQIFDAVESGKADLGLVIHEGQITYEARGLSKAADLGEWWFELFKLPLPLGVDVIRRDLGEEIVRSFTQVFKDSIVYALEHRQPALEYARQYGRGISESLNDQFVGMYVNDFTVDLGPRGETGLKKLYDLAYEHRLIPQPVRLDFVSLV